jgi:uncharacterized protein (DUF58 family)
MALRNPVTLMAERASRARGLDRPRPVVALDYNRVYILPTWHGLAFATLLALMLIGVMNYRLSLGYVLVFLLGGMALASMLHTFRNLNRLVLRAGRTKPVFAGDVARFNVGLENPTRTARFAVALRRDRAEPRYADLKPLETVCLPVTLTSRRRGWLRPGRLVVDTRFPLGLFRAWAWVELDVACLVYPRPARGHIPFPAAAAGGNALAARGVDGDGRDDFAGLRAYRPGDSLRHVAWKSLARNHGLLTKHFAGDDRALPWFDYDHAPAIDHEGRLSVLCRWVLDAHAMGLPFGLRLPDRSFEPDTGDAHMRRCLEALALYGHGGDGMPRA